MKKVLRWLFVGICTPENIPNTRVRRTIIFSLYVSAITTHYWMWRALRKEDELISLTNEELQAFRPVPVENTLNISTDEIVKCPECEHTLAVCKCTNLENHDINHPTVAEGTTPADYGHLPIEDREGLEPPIENDLEQQKYDNL